MYLYLCYIVNFKMFYKGNFEASWPKPTYMLPIRIEQLTNFEIETQHKN